MELKLTIKDFISVNHYLEYKVVRVKNRYLPTAYKPERTKKFERNFSSYVKEEMRIQGWATPPKGKFVNLNTTFYFPETRMDAQNYFKSISDVMSNCGVWIDDNIVMEKVDRIYYDTKNPRIELTVTYSDVVGIFDTKDESEEFENKCSTCKRYKNNCSILKKAKESRIQADIIRNNDKWICLTYKEKKSN